MGGVNEQVASPQGSVNPTTPHLHNGINTPPSLPPPNVPPTTLNSPQIPESQPASPFANDNHPKSINHHIFLPLSLFFHTSLHTTSNKLPIYLLWKRGGNKKLTRVRKIEGDVNLLKSDLQAALGVKEGDVTVNQLARQVIVKGHMKPQIEQFFKDLQQ